MFKLIADKPDTTEDINHYNEPIIDTPKAENNSNNKCIENLKDVMPCHSISMF